MSKKNEVREWAERVIGNMEDYITDGTIGNEYDLWNILKEYRSECTEKQYSEMISIVTKWYQGR